MWAKPSPPDLESVERKLTMNSLEAFYQTELLPHLERLDKDRQTAKKKLIPLVAALVVLAFLCLYAIGKWRLSLGFMIIPLCIAFVVLFGWYAKYFKQYKDAFKETIIPKIVAFIDPALSYDRSGMVPKEDFFSSHLFAGRADRYRGDDLVSGILGKTAIRFSEIRVQQVETVRREHVSGSSANRTRKKFYPIFSGLFFVADFNKDFNGTTIVLPDTAQRLLGDLGQALQKLNVGSGQLIKLEDPEFEKRFVVYGQDQVESRYILSTSLMRRIMAFQQRAPRDMRLSFSGSKLYAAIPFDRELFEPGLMDSLMDISQIREYYENLKLVIDIVEELNLNTRIWSKA